MITFPNAKINLGLNIVEKRPDGYHNLETVFFPINLQDALEVKPLEEEGKDYKISMKGNALDCNPDDNLVVKAYKLLKQDCRYSSFQAYTEWSRSWRRFVRLRIYDKDA